MTERLAYRVAEAAETIGVSRAKCYELIAAGAIPSIRIGSLIRIPADGLREWIAKQLEPRQEPEPVKQPARGQARKRR